MVQALIPRVLDGQEGRREARGIILYGDVTAVRVEGSVTDASAFTGDGVPERQRRSMFGDVNVLGRGGRVHPFLNCACQVPVKVGDPVILEMPHGDPTKGCFVIGTQVPRRPLAYQSPKLSASDQVNATTRLLTVFVPYEYNCGWQQSLSFNLDASLDLDWTGRAVNWDANKPTAAYVEIHTVIQKQESGAWSDAWVMPTRRLDGPVAGGARLHGYRAWTEVIDDGDVQIEAALAGGDAYRLIFEIVAGSVHWYNSVAGDWQTTSLSSIDTHEYSVAVVELGGGTY